MDFLTTIVTALVAGAAESVKDTAKQAVKDAYAAIKGYFTEKQPATAQDLASLETDPQSNNRRAVLEETLTKDAEALSQDPSFGQKIQALVDAIKAEGVSESMDGIDIEGLTTQGDATIKDVNAGKIKIHLTKIGGKLRIENINTKKN